MNWNQIQGQWHEFAEHAKSQWSKLTLDDLKGVAKREDLIGKLEERYGILKHDAEKQIDKWIAKIKSTSTDESS